MPFNVQHYILEKYVLSRRISTQNYISFKANLKTEKLKENGRGKKGNNRKSSKQLYIHIHTYITYIRLHARAHTYTHTQNKVCCM
jgi:hypothetical protein